MDELSPDDLIAAYRYELQRVNGKEYALACLVEYRKGWFYVHYPIKEGKDYRVSPVSKPIRRGELIRMIEELRGK
jgi:hypothetical protein